MKRFWLENRWPWSKTWTMTSRKMSRANLTFVILMLVQLVPSSCTVDKKCKPNNLLPCDENEICVVDGSGNGVCQCQAGFIFSKETGKCEKPKPPPEPSKNYWAVGLGIGLTFFLLFVVVILLVLHYKFGLLSGMCDRLPRVHLFGSSGREFNMVDNEDDDVNPIV